MKFAELRKLVPEIEETEITLQEDLVFRVKNYITTEDKYRLIKEVAAVAIHNRKVDHFAADMLFHLKIVEYYTSIHFTNSQKIEALNTYDVLCRLGIVEAVLETVPEKEYDFLANFLQKELESNIHYETSFAPLVATIESAIAKIPDDISNLDIASLSPIIQELGETLKEVKDDPLIS